MRFKDFIERGQVRKTSKNLSLVKSLIKTSDEDLKFIKSLEISNKSARKIMVSYYDILRSVIEAMSILDGYKVYSHEAFTHFLKERGENLIAQKFDRFRIIRNKINYYGKSISVEEVKENTKEIIRIIEILKKRHLSSI
ncbi:MAG: hypothetical protein KJ767_01690 [Nanoarchaeota archaeon]|nr:hypothetical protein [Nanoarchaeota archaeon]